MLFSKACPKCRGDVHILKDRYGIFVQCLQCGLLKDVIDNEIPWGIRLPSGMGGLLVDRNRPARAQG